MVSLLGRCEAGDLTGKFGPLMQHNNLDVTDTTGQLTLSGPQSILGRSVVVHSSVDGSNFECGTIQLANQAETTGMKLFICFFLYLRTLLVRIPSCRSVFLLIL